MNKDGGWSGFILKLSQKLLLSFYFERGADVKLGAAGCHQQGAAAAPGAGGSAAPCEEPVVEGVDAAVLLRPPFQPPPSDSSIFTRTNPVFLET